MFVMKYHSDFELTATSLKHVSDNMLLCIFHKRLKTTIQSEISVDEFENLRAMMNKAMCYENRERKHQRD